MKAIVMSSDDSGTFHMKALDNRADVPAEAQLDNQAEIDGEVIPVYAMPGTAVIGRTFALQMWLEDVFDTEVESDDSLNVENIDQG